jgi:hypothetical protein
MTQTIAKVGTLLSVETGSYSDYSVVGFFVVLRDFSPADELKEYLTAHPGERERYHFSGDKVLAAILAKGLLLEIKYGVLHLDDYGDVEEFRFTPISSDQPS